VPRTFERNGDDLSLMSDFQDNARYPGRRTRGVLMWRKGLILQFGMF
jgi:hypothetical protein